MNIIAASATATPSKTQRSAADWCFLACWAIVAVATGGWLFVMQPIWASKPDLADRFLIPTAAGWLIYRNWKPMERTAALPAAWGLLPMGIGAIAFAVGWYVAVQVSGRPIVAWWLTTSLIVMILGLTVAHVGRRRAYLLIFPLAFCFFALPTPGRIYNPLQLRLKQFTTLAAEKSLPWLGVPVRREPDGFELTLASGSLGVVEACSGVRSITALTAIAVLVAYLRGFGFFRGLTLVGLTLGVVAVSNSIRVITTGVLQEYIGRAAISGWAHDALGISVILIGLAMIVALSSLIAPRPKENPAEADGNIDVPINRPASAKTASVAFAILSLCLTAGLWSEQFRIDHRVVLNLEQLPVTLGDWKGADLPVDELVKEELLCNQLLHRNYRGPLGEEVSVWVMFWANAATTAHMHHPDICYPYRGWTVTQSHVQPIDLGNGDQLPVSMRHYAKPVQQQILFFWTQNGAFVVPDGIEAPEQMSGHSWIFRLFKGHKPIDQGARISVLLGAQTRGSVESGEAMLREFGGKFARELYHLCPWATPKNPNTN